MAGLSNWWNLREAATPYFAKVGKGGLPATLTELGKEGVKLVVIDTPPAVNAAIGAIIKAASIVLVPVIPSPNDLMAIGETLDIVFKMGRPLVFVVNNAGSGRLTGQAATVLSQHGTVSPVILRTRQDFRAAMIDGRTAVETVPKGKSAGRGGRALAIREGSHGTGERPWRSNRSLVRRLSKRAGQPPPILLMPWLPSGPSMGRSHQS